jgi:hypothetical protein
MRLFRYLALEAIPARDTPRGGDKFVIRPNRPLGQEAPGIAPLFRQIDSAVLAGDIIALRAVVLAHFLQKFKDRILHNHLPFPGLDPDSGSPKNRPFEYGFGQLDLVAVFI